MTITSQLSANQRAYRELKPIIDQTYPRGQFVALHQGRVLADAVSFQELDAALTAKGLTSRDILVVEAGVQYPDYADILTQDAVE